MINTSIVTSPAEAPELLDLATRRKIGVASTRTLRRLARTRSPLSVALPVLVVAYVVGVPDVLGRTWPSWIKSLGLPAPADRDEARTVALVLRSAGCSLRDVATVCRCSRQQVAILMTAQVMHDESPGRSATPGGGGRS